MYICEFGFDHEDPNKKGYSLRELDFYMWFPGRVKHPERDQRLSMRKNFKTQKFELYRFFFISKHEEIVLATKDLQEILNEANKIWNSSHGKWSKESRERDKVCKHVNPEIDSICKFKREKIGK